MNQKEDKAFILKFSGIIIGFIVLTVVLIFVARGMEGESDPNANPSQVILEERRIQPVAGVRVGDEGAAALRESQAAATSQVAATQAAPETAAADAGAEGIDGGQVYGGLCQTCHTAGVAGAPMPGSEQLTQRLNDKGLDELVNSVINGLNVMPPKGGNPALSDEEIRAAVEFMLN
jgi:cytochrome c5